MAIINVDFVDGLKLLYKPNSVDHKALLLVTSNGGQKANIMPFTSWIVSPTDPQGWLVSIYVFTKHYSHELIEQTGQFTVNVPRDGMEDIVKFCGSVSGRNHDKFKEMNLTQAASQHVAPPIIGECSVHLECETGSASPFTMTFPGQDKEDIEMTIFEARIVAIHAADDVAREISDAT